MGNIILTQEEIETAKFVLDLLRDIETPMLMYQHEKDIVCKALKILLDKWNLQNK